MSDQVGRFGQGRGGHIGYVKRFGQPGRVPGDVMSTETGKCVGAAGAGKSSDQVGRFGPSPAASGSGPDAVPDVPEERKPEKDCRKAAKRGIRAHFGPDGTSGHMWVFTPFRTPYINADNPHYVN